jgi:hypothetical protein
MALTAQFAAQTPKPKEAMTVEKRTNVATNAFKFGPSQCSVNFAFYSNLGVISQLRRGCFPTLAALTLVSVNR